MASLYTREANRVLLAKRARLASARERLMMRAAAGKAE